MIRTLTPNPSFDHTYEVGRFEPGAVNRAHGVTIAAAGKGVNVARNAVANGFAAAAVVPGNRTDGASFAAELARFEVGCEIIDRAEPTRRNITILDDDGTTSKVNEAGAPLDDALVEALLTAVASNPDAHVAGCGSLPPATDLGLYARVAATLPAPERQLALDTSGAALAACVDVPCLVVKPNREELEALVDDRLDTYGDLVDVAGDLVRRGWQNVLVSLGAAGAVLVNARGAWAGSAPIDAVVNTVGAGDAALTGFLCGEADGEALAAALAFGRATVASPATAGAVVSDADRAAVVLRAIDATESLGEETG
ncbi:MAG: hexose kinase [Actinomycetota bacterium]